MDGLPWASSADILRAHDKNEFYARQLETRLTDTCNGFLGEPWTMKHKREVQLFSKALFYGPSALRGLPSPGEQYCELMPVMADSPSPSRFASRLFYICHVFGGYGLTLVAKKFKSMAVAHRWTGAKRFLKAYPLLKSLASAFHVALFYFDSAFYSIAHRIAGIRYKRLRRYREGEQAMDYRMIGILVLLQILIRLCFSTTSEVETLAGEEESQSKAAVSSVSHLPGLARSVLRKGTGKKRPSSAPQCMLCLSPRQDSASTPCGHIFCWRCIAEWTRSKPECPLCRQGVFPNELALLQVSAETA